MCLNHFYGIFPTSYASSGQTFVFFVSRVWLSFDKFPVTFLVSSIEAISSCSHGTEVSIASNTMLFDDWTRRAMTDASNNVEGPSWGSWRWQLGPEEDACPVESSTVRITLHPEMSVYAHANTLRLKVPAQMRELLPNTFRSSRLWLPPSYAVLRLQDRVLLFRDLSRGGQWRTHGKAYVYFQVFPSPPVRFPELWILFSKQIEGLRSRDMPQPNRE